MDRPVTKVLLVEDEPVDAKRVRRDLEADSGAAGRARASSTPGDQSERIVSAQRAAGERRSQYELDHAPVLQAGIDRLAKGDIDVVLLDLNLPDSNGVETVVRLREHDGRVPIVVFTGAGDEETAVAALEAGAQDYLVKDELGGSLLRRSIRYAVERQRIAQEAERLQARLRQVEKMESLGVLSAGIAFTFNDVLGTIFERCDEALAELQAPECESRLRTALFEIHRAAFRAAEAVTQLRDYAALEAKPERVDLSGFVLEASTMLESMVAPNIDLSFDVSDDALRVEIRKSELHRVLMSLVVNAAEAIGAQSGSIRISTGTLTADAALLAEAVGARDPRPGRYVFLRVTDTGPGIEPARKARIFDPFYSTKSAGRGLGLASVVGILERRRAVIRVDPGQPTGSVFTLLFPRLGRQGGVGERDTWRPTKA